VRFEELHRGSDELLERELAAPGRLAVGTLCSYVPVEILHSFGVVPVRLWGRSGDVGRADALLQQFICPPVRHLAALGIEGRYGFLDGIVHCYTCDATCGLYNIWVRNMEPGFRHLVSLPYMKIDEALDYAVAEYRVLISKLESLTGTAFSTGNLAVSIELYSELRAMAREVYTLRARGARMSYAEVYHMNLCCQVLPVETMLPLLGECVSGMKRAGTAAPGRPRPRVMLSGSVINESALLRLIEEVGADIVADDTCLGVRPLGGPPPRDGTLESLAEHYLSVPPCSSRADFPARKAFLLDTVGEYGAGAVLFLHHKYCDPHLSDHPYLKGVLEEAGVPSARLEMDADGLTGQARTRIEGFIEMLETR